MNSDSQRVFLAATTPGKDDITRKDAHHSYGSQVPGLNSIPLCLLWDSAFVDTISSSDYIFNAIAEGFPEVKPYNNTHRSLHGYPDAAQSMLERYRGPILVNLTVADRMKAYGNEFVASYSNVLLVYDIYYEYNSLLLHGQNGGTGRKAISNAGYWV